MSMDETGGERLPEEMLAIASAIAARNIQGGEDVDSVMNALDGTPGHQLSDEATRARALNHTVRMLQRVAAPEAPIPGGRTATMLTDEEIREEMPAVDDELFSPTVESMRTAHDSFMSQTDERAESTDEDAAKEFAALFNAANAVAEEAGVSVAAVYEKDELYYEAQRRSTTPHRLAFKSLDLMTAMSDDVLKNVLMSFLDETIAPDLKEAAPDEVRELLLELELGGQLQEVTASLIETAHEAIRQIFVMKATKIWGFDGAMAVLSDPNLVDLIPKRPLIPAVQEIIANQ